MPLGRRASGAPLGRGGGVSDGPAAQAPFTGTSANGPRPWSRGGRAVNPAPGIRRGGHDRCTTLAEARPAAAEGSRPRPPAPPPHPTHHMAPVRTSAGEVSMKGFVQDIESLAVGNEEFRRVLYTAQQCQLVLLNA